MVFNESSLDYDANSSAAKHFFAIAQDKFHYAVSQKTAAEIVLERADGEKDKVGMIAYRGEQPTFQDVKTAKNYLDAEEMRLLQNIFEQFLLFAESKAFRGQKMTMEELATKLNVLLMANDYPVLYEYPAYKRGQADEHAKAELKKYQNKLGSGDVSKALDRPDSTPTDATEEALKRAVRVSKPKENSKEGDEEQSEI